MAETEEQIDLNVAPEELLVEACRRGNEDLLATTLAGGMVNILFVDGLGNTALHYAAGGGHAKCLEMILAAGGSSVAAVANFSGDTPMHKAATGGNPVCVQLLVDAGALGRVLGAAATSRVLAPDCRVGAPTSERNADGKLPLDLVGSAEAGEILQTAIYGATQVSDEFLAGSDDEDE